MRGKPNLYQQSLAALTTIVQYANYDDLLRFNLVGRKFYEQVVPNVMAQRQVLPRIDFFRLLHTPALRPTIDIRVDAKRLRRVLRTQYLGNAHWDKYLPENVDWTTNVSQQKQRIELWEQGRMVGYYKGKTKMTSGQPQPHDKHGEMKLHDTLYQGSFQNGSRVGYGCIRWQNGNIYYGEFRDNEACGTGIMVYYDNSAYLGEFKNSKRHGHGFVFKSLDDKEFKNLRDKGLPATKKKMKFYADKEDFD